MKKAVCTLGLITLQDKKIKWLLHARFMFFSYILKYNLLIQVIKVLSENVFVFYCWWYKYSQAKNNEHYVASMLNVAPVFPF